jgi:hypothetical protein
MPLARAIAVDLARDANPSIETLDLVPSVATIQTLLGDVRGKPSLVPP